MSQPSQDDPLPQEAASSVKKDNPAKPKASSAHSPKLNTIEFSEETWMEILSGLDD